ncbi:glycosyltransferase family 4 protein [Mesorhizobium sp.]|uniref:glycosyltransferase family 4 protein n=1 Tax=Mesorhizobium sp. TaxID=1871066 RepID=UPI000FE80BF2|nr:glycosyltransferase family 4 protein [Mesorhizobium sp.]RWO56011.1 MAG: glycosyltransferase family 1 protein [Mesorhizobium sp.]TIL54726.1 MAG: glycosyltransferase family 4 protein [Mesorhizobium sp.]TIL62409.1 MAG: glycosyltransferase family 4 protein [Mesorhizobium sp.]TIL94340.1 MAG: glycosyltransferase family 4 protein [Mesorhizobium sp.]TIM51105.1 MAG: glycosyltransferase family 4 protein [Mesorhizobium sp.]
MHAGYRGIENQSDRPILFVRQRYAPFGGGEIMLENIMAAFAARQRPVAVLSGDWPRHEGIEFIQCAGRRFPRYLRATSFARAACSKIAEMPPALVQSNDRLPCCDVFRAGEGVHAAYLAERRRFETRLGRAAMALSPFHRQTLRLERATYASPRLKAVIAISKMVAEDVVRHYDYPAERVHHIPNGVDLDLFNPKLRQQHRAVVRSRLGVNDDRPVVLFVGSGFARKGLLALMKSVAMLDGEPELWVIGHDSRADAFKQAGDRLGLGARLRMLGPQKDTLPWYGAADIAVLPSIYDPFGTVVIEAMASGLPAVVSTGCGARELVDRFEPTLVCDAAGVDDLAAGLARALQLSSRPETAARVRAAAEHYDFNVMIRRMIALYENLDLK